MISRLAEPTARTEPPPTDLELMLYADGELDESSAAGLRRRLHGRPDAKAKLRALFELGDLVRRAALAGPAPDVVEAVVRRIAEHGQDRPGSTAR